MALEGDPSPYQAAPVLDALVDVHARAGEWPEAADYALRATDVVNQTDNLIAGRSARDRQLVRFEDLFRSAAYALAMSGRGADAVSILERGRARASAETIDVAGSAEERHRRHQLRQLEAKTRRRALLREPDYEDAIQVLRESETESLIEGLLRRKATATRTEHAESTEDAATGWADAVLPAVPVVNVLTTSEGSLAIVLHREAVDDPVSVDVLRLEGLRGQDLADLMSIGEGKGWKPDGSDAITATLQSVGPRVSAPIASRLRSISVDSVVLILSGLLKAIPLHAAPYDGTGTSPHCLLDDFVVSYAASLDQLSVVRARVQRVVGGGRTPKRRQFLVVGNPLPHPLPLPLAETEARMVATTMRRAGFGKVRLLTGQAATRDKVVRSLARSTWIHLACHGVREPGEPLSRRLEFADRGSIDAADILSAWLFKDTRLVVMAGCETASSSAEVMSDEAIGLPTSMIQGGATGVVGALWPVLELPTLLLMSRFYRILAGGGAAGSPDMSPASALRAAQLWLRDLTAADIATTLSGIHPGHPDLDRLMSIAHTWPNVRPHQGNLHHWAPYLLVGV